MSGLASVVDEILKLHGPPAYALVGGLAFAEAALFVGFVLPGETAVLLGGVLANQHQVSLAGIATVSVLAAIFGDTVGYAIGRHFGSRVLALRVLSKRQHAVDRGLKALRDNAGRAVFLARFTAFFRAVMPGLAGTARVPYRRFLVFNAAGGLVWALGFTALGFAVGAGYRMVERVAGRASELILVVVILAALVLAALRRRGERDAARGGPLRNAGNGGCHEPLVPQDEGRARRSPPAG
jgi:membrane-associated protein